MPATILLPLIAAFAYFMESVFGFGGTVIFLGLGGFVLDFKTLLHISMVVSAICSAAILAQTWRHFSGKHFLRIFAVALPFVILGTWLIDALRSLWLLKTFAVLLVVYGLQGLLWPKFKPPRAVSYAFVAGGGLIQGLFTAGGPFILMGYRSFFDNKTQLKATMAAFFLSSNIWRMGQTMFDGSVAPAQLAQALWLGIPVVAGVWLGHHVHLRLSEQSFQRGLMACMIAAGVILLLKQA